MTFYNGLLDRGKSYICNNWTVLEGCGGQSMFGPTCTEKTTPHLYSTTITSILDWWSKAWCLHGFKLWHTICCFSTDPPDQTFNRPSVSLSTDSVHLLKTGYLCFCWSLSSDTILIWCGHWLRLLTHICMIFCFVLLDNKQVSTSYQPLGKIKSPTIPYSSQRHLYKLYGSGNIISSYEMNYVRPLFLVTEWCPLFFCDVHILYKLPLTSLLLYFSTNWNLK